MLYLLLAYLSRVRTAIAIKTFQKRFVLSQKLGTKVYIPMQEHRVLIVIAHVVPDAELHVAEKLPRLICCLDAVISSMANVNFKIYLLTKEHCSLYKFLPSYLQKVTEPYYSTQQNPMYVEYDAFDVFKSRRGQFDFYLFIEDDIIINDSWFLQKLISFYAVCPYKNWLLFPHRFEYYQGVKFYLDQHVTLEEVSSKYSHDKQKITLDGVDFCFYENPHAAFYCLNNIQLDIWVDSGFKWKNKGVAFGSLESAATFCHFENFKILKPHPDTINYFEVQHFGNKFILGEKVLDRAAR